ncbi:MAG: hypothetical protein ACHQ7M_18825 [Chloroflexota bacterium]
MKLSSAMTALDARLPDGPVHRLIFAVDIEGSTERNNLAKGQLRRALYNLLETALKAAGIATRNLEPFADRGDSVLILIKPHDEVPKTLVLGQLIPILAGLLDAHNALVTCSELQMRLRAVVHAGEVHEDSNGFYGDDLDAAFRLLEASALKKALKDAAATSLILVVSEEIFNGIIRQGYLNDSSYRPLVRVKVGRRQRRGWAHIPESLPPTWLGASRRPGGQLPSTQLAIALVNGHGLVPSEVSRPDRSVIESGAPPPGRG